MRQLERKYGEVFPLLLLVALAWKTVDVYYPTIPFTMLEPQNRLIDQLYVFKERQATDLKAPKL